MIDESRYAFGLDTERYSSNPDLDKWMDWEAVALHDNPPVTFVVTRAGISWGYQDPLFPYNWRGIREIDLFRLAAGIEMMPVGRGAYHVLYPGENPISQYDIGFNLASPVITQHFGFVGTSLRVSEHTTFSATYIHGFENEVSGPIQSVYGPVPGSSVYSAASLDALAIGITVQY